MWDLSTQEVGAKLSQAWNAGKVLAAVCHGPAALVHVTDSQGKPVVSGRRFSAFSDAEERAAGLEAQMPFLLESKLVSLGGVHEKADLWQPHTTTDGRLVTGQNPASSRATAVSTLKAIESTRLTPSESR